MFLQKPSKESPCCGAISPFLEKYINNLTILVNRSPEVMLFTINLDENLINEKCITISPMIFLQPGSIFWTKSIAPQSDRFVTDIYPALG